MLPYHSPFNFEHFVFGYVESFAISNVAKDGVLVLFPIFIECIEWIGIKTVAYGEIAYIFPSIITYI